MVKNILDTSLSPLALEASYPWSTLHIVCQLGQIELAESFTRQHGEALFGAGAPSQFDPLLVTASRGLYDISHRLRLVLKDAKNAERPGDISLTPLHVASKNSFIRTLTSLIDDHGCSVSLETRDNPVLIPALKCGNQEIAT